MLASCPPSVYEPVAITELSPNRQMDIPLEDVRVYFALSNTVTHCHRLDIRDQRSSRSDRQKRKLPQLNLQQQHQETLDWKRNLEGS